MKKLQIALIFVLTLAAALCAGCVWEAEAAAPPPADPVVKLAQPKAPPAEEEEPEEKESYVTVTDYAGICARIQELLRQQFKNALRSDAIMYEDMAVDEAMPAEAPAAEPTAAADNSASMDYGKGGADDYSETNVQVAGIDEADIVKTDGKSIFILRDNEVIILKAAGADTAELSRIKVGDSDGHGKGYASEIYVTGDRLVVIRNAYHWDGSDQLRGFWWGYDYTEALLYDVSDPAAPKKIGAWGQDGRYLSSRLLDGVLYLVSNYHVYNTEEELDPDQPGLFVPSLYRNGKAAPMAAADICICPRFDSVAYTVITTIDVAADQRLSQQSTLGGGTEIYMNADNLFISSSNYREEVGEAYTEAVYTVEEHRSYQETEILRFAIDAGRVAYAAGGTVNGYLVNQFAMDEYQGYLRVVTTRSEEKFTTYTDKERGWVNYVWDEEGNRMNNALYVLDSDLKVVGSVEELAEDERVYSVRFNGAIGYFVTFRQVDPLFAVDLSDPAAPRVLSALKIPGFSEYLHVYSEDLLFGLGMNADEKTGWSENMKLSMFNVADPADVFEQDKKSLEISWSAALHNHKAILVLPDKDIIGFPSETGYLIYGYSEKEGFYRRGEIDFSESGEWWYGDCRGLYIGGSFYVCGYNGVAVMDLETLSLILTLTF